MSKIISIGTAIPAFKHEQSVILDFMQRVYALDEKDKRKLKYLYRQGGIDTRYSVIPDYSSPAAEWAFYSSTENLEPFPKLEKRMQWYQQHAAQLSLAAINKCIDQSPEHTITHLITVSCTGMSAPGLDLELLELLNLPTTTFRTSINFMGCYAAIHALKIADAFCKADKKATVLIVCTELCTLHFQKEHTVDNMTSSMLFSDGAAAVLVTGNEEQDGLTIDNFYSMVSLKGKKDMAWQLSSKGFLMTLSGYVADMIEEDFDVLVQQALAAANLNKENITQWCIHPGGKKILEAVHKSLGFTNGQLQTCYDVLRDYGNMSSPTVLFVLENIMATLNKKQKNTIFGAAFGPGLTMETFILSA
ncbi:naringenin-chalcone synthase [Chitinophagaceae bacterium IBVUCB2]|nr:naringenin-chalcone synthase [Chitinophagaceae bacterium IBVUCB2]